MRQELENRNIVFNCNYLVQKLSALPIGNTLLELNGKFDVDIHKNISFSSRSFNRYTSIYLEPKLLFSFTNQYVEDDIWHYDFDIKTKIDWYIGNNYWDVNKEYFDYNKLIWNDTTNLIFTVSGYFNGFNSAWGGENKIFTAHSTTNFDIADNVEWPRNWFDNKYGEYGYGNYVNKISNNSRLILDNPTIFNCVYFKDNNGKQITSGYPIQSWYEIYNKNGLWQPINNRNNFEVWNGQIYIGDFLNQSYNFNGYTSNNINIIPTSNRNSYNLLVYLNYEAIENDLNNSNKNYWYKAPTYEDIMGENKILQVQKWNKDEVRKINYSGNFNSKKYKHISSWKSAYYYNGNLTSTFNLVDNFTGISNIDMFIAYGLAENTYYINYYIDTNDNNNCFYRNLANIGGYYGTSSLNSLYNDRVPTSKWPHNKHIDYFYLPQINKIINDNNSWYFNLDWPDNSTLEIVGMFINNLYTINFFNQIGDQEPFVSKNGNYKHYIYAPDTNPSTLDDNLRFYGWKFENGENLRNGTVLCNTNYNLYAIWENIKYYNITYTFLNGKGNRNSVITDKWNEESVGLVKNQDVTYLKQMNTWVDTIKYWRDIDTNLFYYPGQRVDHTLNLVYECDVDNNADWKNIITVPISFLDYSSVNNIGIKNGYSYSAELMSAEFLNIGEGSPICNSFNDIFYVNNSSNILNSAFKWNISNMNNDNGMKSFSPIVSKNLIDLGQGSVYNNLTSTASFSPYMFRFCITDDEYIRGDNNWDLKNNGIPIVDDIGSCWLTNPHCDITFNNIWNFLKTTNLQDIYSDSDKNNYGFLVFASSIRPLYMLGADWHNLSKRYDQILPVPFKAGYKFNGWWYNKSQFTDENGKCLVAQFSSLYNIIFPNKVDKPWPEFEEINFSAKPSECYYGLNNVFYPEFINLKNDFKHHFPYVLVNRNAEENVNFFDYSRIYTTKWLNNYTTFNNSYYFPSQLVPYQE